MHPDERAVILFTNELSFPSSLPEFLKKDSDWNPHFFAYGSLPLYLLYWAGKVLSLIRPEYFSYDYLTLIGRCLSLIADLGTLALVFFIGKKLWSEKVGLLASFFYGFSVLPIQLSRFYAVDTLLTFFIMLTLYLLIKFYAKPSLKTVLLIGASLACAFATKISATVLLASFVATIILDFALLFIKQPHRPSIWAHHIPAFFKKLLYYFSATGTVTIVLFFILQPYVALDFQEFAQQTLAQAAMTKDAFTFPYTLQYVGKIPYLYDLMQIFFVGLGPILATICFGGILIRGISIARRKALNFSRAELILLLFFIVYFFIVGKFAIGFMRYMLPLYPILTLFGALFCYQLFIKINSTKRVVLGILLSTFLIWPISFMTIYAKPFTRYEASLWITKNIPPQSTLAIEHWDDSLPIFNAGAYKYETLPLYEADTPAKWESINLSLQRSDYIILASNRLYTPLKKLTTCAKLPPGKCYIQTARYYDDLFAEKLGFKKVAEFTSFAHIPFTAFEFDDQKFDESFSVYDHPVVTIFKNTKKY